MGRRAKPEHPDEPATTLPAGRYVLGLLTPKKDGCSMTMLLARRVKVETIGELIAAGLAITSIERVGRGAIQITRVKITDAGLRVLLDGHTPADPRGRDSPTCQPHERRLSSVVLDG
jgi:hypothetical protein